MKNSTLSKAFLVNIEKELKNKIINNIADHYNVSEENVFDEIYDDEAENLLDYITGDLRKVVADEFATFKRKYLKKEIARVKLINGDIYRIKRRMTGQNGDIRPIVREQGYCTIIRINKKPHIQLRVLPTGSEILYSNEIIETEIIKEY